MEINSEDLLYIEDISKRAKKASRFLRSLKTGDKNRFLRSLARSIRENQSFLIQENQKDLEDGKKKALSSSLLDRLLLNESRIEALAKSVEDIANLPDPVGEVVRGTQLPNGLELITKQVPIGVVLVIYESRPNVTIDVGALCFKSGNVGILRGGSEAIHSNRALAEIFRKSLDDLGLEKDSLILIERTDRSLVIPLLKQVQFIDLVVPRGGEGLIRFVSQNSEIPVVKHDKGVCNLFVDSSAIPERTIEVVINSKVQRPGVCNALENLIIHKDYPRTKELLSALQAKGVELYVDEPLRNLLPGLKEADEEAYKTEYLDLKLSVKTVSSLMEAIDFIETYSSGHTEAILSESYENIEEFTSSIDSAAVFVNCSTRFHDGGEFGLGAEVGISTGKLHVRGPMGLMHLTTTKTVLKGRGQVR